MSLLPLLALAALVVAVVFFVRARTLVSDLSASREKTKSLAAELAQLQAATAQRSQKEGKRGGELEDLRERERALRRRLNEAQMEAKQLQDAEDQRAADLTDAREQTSEARAEAAEASQLTRTLRTELEALRSQARRAVARPAPSEEMVAPVAAVPIFVPRPNAEISDLEARLREQQARSEESEARAKSEQRKALDAQRELDRSKAKISTADKLYIVQKGELELWKDRYRSLEQRLNRTLREVDALHRGVLALERRLPQVTVEEARAEALAQAPALPPANEEAPPESVAEETRGSSTAAPTAQPDAVGDDGSTHSSAVAATEQALDAQAEPPAAPHAGSISGVHTEEAGRPSFSRHEPPSEPSAEPLSEPPAIAEHAAPALPA